MTSKTGSHGGRACRTRRRHELERHMILFTHNEESALLLKSAFLPGQQAELKLRDRDAFARGVMRALEMLGGGGED